MRFVDYVSGICAFLALVSHKYSIVASGFLREDIHTIRDLTGSWRECIYMAFLKAKITIDLYYRKHPYLESAAGTQKIVCVCVCVLPLQ